MRSTASECGGSMRVMGIEAVCAPARAKPRPGTRYTPPPTVEIVEPNHVWAADVTYIPMVCGFLDRVAIIDGVSRWSGMAAVEHQRCEFLRGGAGGGLLRFGKPRIFNTDQGSTFTAEAFTSKLVTARLASRFRWTMLLHAITLHRTAMALDQVRRSASESLRRWLRGAVRISSG